MHFARGMPGRKIQLGEVVVVALDVGPLGDREAHFGEDHGDLVQHLADRMDAPGDDARRADRQRDVERVGLQPVPQRRRPQESAPRGESFGHLVLERVDRRAGASALVGRHLAQRREHGGDRAFLAQRGDPRRLQRAFVGGRGDGGQSLGFEGG